jgi:hypothetical protein
MANTTTVSIELDARNRAPLGKLATSDRYIATVDAAGRIVMEPAVLLTTTELRLLKNDAYWTAADEAAGEDTSDYVDLEVLPPA